MTFKDWNEAYQHGSNAREDADALWARQKANGHGYNSKDARASQSFTAAELQSMEFSPIKFVVPRVFVEGLSLFAGKPKAGKSWLLLHAAIAVTRGGYTLGEIHCIEGDVLYCALEDNPRRLKRRVKKLLGSDRRPQRLKFECRMPRLREGGVDFIRRWIERVSEPRLVVIDTLAKVRDPKGAQESSYEADYRSVSELKALADEKGIAIVLVHHQRKMTADDPLDTVSGTTGLTGAVDSVLVLVRDGSAIMLHGTGRDLEQIEDAVEFDREACLWRILGKVEDVRRSDERRTILKVLGDATGPLATREITDLAEMSYEAGRKRLARMVTDNEIDRVGRGLFKLSQPLSQIVPMSQSRGRRRWLIGTLPPKMSQSIPRPPQKHEGLGHVPHDVPTEPLIPRGIETLGHLGQQYRRSSRLLPAQAQELAA